mmetsp:Transcript_4179/g.9929  ORF Transcript_4179/g.9929 Transcript_4179/m.9929 type:complete len:201 (-) Transcript_4179:9-611(-)
MPTLRLVSQTLRLREWCGVPSLPLVPRRRDSEAPEAQGRAIEARNGQEPGFDCGAGTLGGAEAAGSINRHVHARPASSGDVGGYGSRRGRALAAPRLLAHGPHLGRGRGLACVQHCCRGRPGPGAAPGPGPGPGPGALARSGPGAGPGTHAGTAAGAAAGSAGSTGTGPAGLPLLLSLSSCYCRRRSGGSQCDWRWGWRC